jgi:pimeloyl-ACP methyl ester carboxylesterase
VLDCRPGRIPIHDEDHAANPWRRRLLVAGGSLATLALLPGCTRVALMLAREPVVPMGTLALPSPCAAGRSRTLLVLLPGAYSRPQEFIDNGIPAALAGAGRVADLLIADAHLGYMGSGSLVARLQQDVLGPARARGYEQIWLVGISLGGWAALACAAQASQGQGPRVDGVFAVAPYLGRRTLLRDLAAAGGPLPWAAMPEAGADAQDMDAQIWRWLARPAPGSAPVWLGWGTEDRFADTNGLAATLLPAERVSTVPGGHDWPPWRALIERWLERAPWPSGCAGAAT